MVAAQEVHSTDIVVPPTRWNVDVVRGLIDRATMEVGAASRMPKNAMSRLTERDLLELRKAPAGDEYDRLLGEKLGVHQVVKPNEPIRSAMLALRKFAKLVLGYLPEPFLLACKAVEGDDVIAITAVTNGLAALHEMLQVCLDELEGAHATVVRV